MTEGKRWKAKKGVDDSLLWNEVGNFTVYLCGCFAVVLFSSELLIVRVYTTLFRHGSTTLNNRTDIMGYPMFSNLYCRVTHSLVSSIKLFFRISHTQSYIRKKGVLVTVTMKCFYIQNTIIHVCETMLCVLFVL